MPDFVDGVVLGRFSRVYVQTRQNSCGPASFRTACYALTGSAPPEEWVRTRSRRNMVSDGIRDRIGALNQFSADTGLAIGVGGGYVADRVSPVDQTAEIEHLVPLFRSFGLRASGEVGVAPPEIRRRLEGAGHARVFIAGVSWSTGGGHWVVVPKATAVDVAVLDPGFGLRAAPGFPAYAPAGGQHGTFDGFLMEIATA